MARLYHVWKDVAGFAAEGQGLPLDEAVELIERVRVSVERHAVLVLDAVTMAVSRILGFAHRCGNCHD